MAKKKDNTPAAQAAETSTSTGNSASTGAPATLGSPAEVAARVKQTKASPVLVKSQAVLDAEAVLAKAQAESLAELKANSQPALDAAAKAVADAKAALKAALKAQKDLNDQLGIVEAPKQKGQAFGKPKAGSYAFVKDFAPDKGAPQARQILEIIKSAAPSSILREDVVKKMEGVVKTTMPLPKLLSYYTKILVDLGLVSIAPPVEAPAVAATAATAATAAA